jgi:flagellar basal body-associated protein FliL
MFQHTGSKSNSTVTIAISVIVVLLVAGLAAIGFCLWTRKRSLHRDNGNCVIDLVFYMPLRIL